MKYAITIQEGDEFNSVNTLIVEDGLAEGEVSEKSWRDGGAELVDILTHCGYGLTEARAIVSEKHYFIINCDDIDYSFADSFICDGCGAELYEHELIDSHCPECKYKIGD